MKTKTKLRIFAIAILAMLIPITIIGQEYKFQLSAKNKDIGILKVVKSESNGKTHYKVTSDVKINLMGKNSINYELICAFENDYLSSSKVKTLVNNKLHSQSEVKETTKGYQIVKDGEKSFWSSKEKYTGAMLYADEPIGVDHVFSEKDGLIKKIRKKSENNYEVLHPTKKKQTQEYTYENGVLKKAIINHPLITFYLVRI